MSNIESDILLPFRREPGDDAGRRRFQDSVHPPRRPISGGIADFTHQLSRHGLDHPPLQSPKLRSIAGAIAETVGFTDQVRTQSPCDTGGHNFVAR